MEHLLRTLHKTCNYFLNNTPYHTTIRRPEPALKGVQDVCSSTGLAATYREQALSAGAVAVQSPQTQRAA